MRAGLMNREITILNPVASQSTVSGTQLLTWSTFIRKAWAQVVALPMRDYTRQDVNAQQVTHRMIMRPSTGLNTKMRVVFSGSTYLIQSIYELDDRTELLVTRLST